MPESSLRKIEDVDGCEWGNAESDRHLNMGGGDARMGCGSPRNSIGSLAGAFDRSLVLDVLLEAICCSMPVAASVDNQTCRI